MPTWAIQEYGADLASQPFGAKWWTKGDEYLVMKKNNLAADNDINKVKKLRVHYIHGLVLIKEVCCLVGEACLWWWVAASWRLRYQHNSSRYEWSVGRRNVNTLLLMESGSVQLGIMACNVGSRYNAGWKANVDEMVVDLLEHNILC